MHNKKNKLKILLIGPLPPPLTGESFCNKVIIESLSNDSNFQVDQINTAPKKFDEKLGKISIHKINHNLKNYFKLYKVLHKQLIYATIGQTFAGILKFAPYFILAKLLRKKIVIHIHGNNLLNQYQKQSGIKRKIFLSIVSLADKGIVLSKGLKPNLEPFLKEQNILILPNFVDNNLLINDIKTIENKDFSQLKILYLSNLMTQKGIFELLDALLELKKRNIKYTAVLAGNMDQSIKKKVLQKIKMLPDVKYVGMLTGEAKKQAYLEANTFILPSYREGQPLSIFEAMATGNIIISTSHPGITDIFNPDQINYIEKKSIKAIVNKLEEINQNLTKFHTQIISNYKYITTKYTEKIFIENFKNIIQIEAK